MGPGTTRRTTAALGLVAASALLAGCFTVEATFTINDDATADVDFVTLIDTSQLQEFAGILGEDAGALDQLSGDALLKELTGGDDPCADFIGDFTDYDVSTREIDEGNEVGVGCTASGIPIADLNSLGDDTSSFTIEQDPDGTTRFDAVLEGVDELTGDPAETAQMTEMLGVSLDDLFTIRFVVSAPGSLGDNNASSTDGATATWDVKPDAPFVTDGNATLTAEWTPGGGGGSGSSWWIILIVVAAVLAIAAIVALVLTRRSKGPAATDGTVDPGGSAPPPPPAMAPPTAPGTTPPPPPAVTEPTPPTPPSGPPSAPPPPPPT
jgi:LppM domain